MRIITFLISLVAFFLIQLPSAQSQTSYPPCLDIQSFGVAINGTADNSAAFQHAIDSAAVIGGTVCMPAGIYRISHTIVVPGGVTLSGSGMGALSNQTPYNGTIIWYTGDSEAVIITGSNSAISNCTIYNPTGNATTGIRLCASNRLVESVVLSRILIYGFTGGTGLRLCASNNGGVTYCSFYDCRIRHAQTGIEIIEGDSTSFVNSNSFFHGAISGGGFSYGILINGGNNNVFYGTVIEPYTSDYGHLVVNAGQVIGENIRIEAAQQPAGHAVVMLGAGSGLCHITGIYGGGVVINEGNNIVQFSSATYTGESQPGYNLLANSAFFIQTAGSLPEYWTASATNIRISTETEEVLAGHKVLTVRVPPGTVCDLYPKPDYAPKLGTGQQYRYAQFNVQARASLGGKVKLTYNYAGGMVSSVAHTGSGAWETVGLMALTSPAINPSPKINLNNSAGTDTLVVSLTAPSFNFGMTVPQRQASVITGAGGIMTGTLTTGLANTYSFTSGTSYLVLPRNGNVFNITGTGLTISRINYLTADRFAPGTVITLLFGSSGNGVTNSAYLSLKSAFTSTGANTSLSLISGGDGTWRELNRNN